MDNKEKSCDILTRDIKITESEDKHALIEQILFTEDLISEKELYGSVVEYDQINFINNTHSVNYFLNKACNDLYDKSPELSAKQFLNRPQKYIMASIIITSLGGLLFKPLIFFFTANILYLLNNLFKLFLTLGGIYYDFSGKAKHNFDKSSICDKSLPIYTVLVPLYKEEKVLNKLINALNNIDYPKNKLDIKIVIEENDDTTINALKHISMPEFCQTIKVPDSLPKTKPKACNYALNFAKGEFITIYDAEDIPSPLQLMEVVAKFRSEKDNVICIQAKLNFYNRKSNILTKLFSYEYSMWFDFMLLGLAKFGFPVPLGGTSNHFKKDKLNELNAWDPYNVTEDADLGLRLACKGYRASIIDSITFEECTSSIKSWINQRSRWIQGYLQTYFVHMRSPIKLVKQLGIKGFLGVQCFVGLPCLIFIIAPLLWLFWGVNSYGMLPANYVILTIINIILAVIHPVISGVASSSKHKWWKELWTILFFPFYWILHSIASFKALKQLYHNPHYWNKTEHGVNVNKEIC